MNGSNRRLEIPRALLARLDAGPAVQGVVGSPSRAIRTFPGLAARSRRKDASYPNSDNRLFTTSTDRSSDSRRRVWFRYADRAGRVAFDGAARTSMGERHAVLDGRERLSRGCRSVLGGLPIVASPPSDSPSSAAFSAVLARSLFPPLASRDTGPSGRSLKNPPNLDRSRSRQRSTVDPRPRTPSVDECPGTRFRGRLGPPPISRLCRLDPASGTRSPGSLGNPARRGADRGLITRAPLRQAPLVDFCNRNNPPARPWIGGDLGLFGPRTSLERRGAEYASLAGDIAGWLRVRGRVAFSVRLSPLGSTSFGAIARVESFSPARLARTPHVAEPGRPSSVECARRSRVPPARHAFTSRAPDRSGGAFPTSLREENSCSTHPRCLPPPGLLVRG
jgi:hypothetical protein